MHFSSEVFASLSYESQTYLGKYLILVIYYPLFPLVQTMQSASFIFQVSPQMTFCLNFPWTLVLYCVPVDLPLNMPLYVPCLNNFNIFNRAKPITSAIMNKWQLVCIQVNTWDRTVTMNVFHRWAKGKCFRENNESNRPDWPEWNQEPKECTVPYHSHSTLFPLPLVFVNLFSFYRPFCQPVSLPAEHISSLPSCLNSLWTPNANSVRHLIRHINSISPLIALIPLSKAFHCSWILTWGANRGL